MALISKGTSFIKTHDENIPEDFCLAHQVQRVHRREHSKMDEVKVLMSQGTPVLKLALRTVSTEKLATIKDIMKTSLRGNKGEGSEIRFLKMPCRCQQDLVF